MTKQEIGRILKTAREKKDLTQKQVAEILQRKQQVIGHWETGYAQPDANTLFELCDLYGISIDDAFGKKTSELANLSSDAIAVARAYDSMSSYGKAIVETVIQQEKSHKSCV